MHKLIEVSCPLCTKTRWIFAQKGLNTGDIRLCHSCFNNRNRKQYESLEDELFQRSNPLNGCLEWQGARNTAGYGFISIDRKIIRVHRLIWQLIYGEIPKGTLVLHKCDNPPCINPGHLFLGSSKDNTQDAMRKGRFRPSEFGKLAHQLVTAGRL